MAYLFHVTYYRNLMDIAHEGLIPNRGSSIGGPAYDYHKRNYLFFSEPNASQTGPAVDDYTAVDYWFNKAEEFADHNSDNCFIDGLVPVVLRVPKYNFVDGELEEDTLGTQDSLHPAYKTKISIEPEYIEVWTGKAWRSLDNWDDINISSAFDSEDDPDAEQEEVEYDENGDPIDWGDPDYDETLHGDDYEEYKKNKNKIFSFKQDNPLLPKSNQLNIE